MQYITTDEGLLKYKKTMRTILRGKNASGEEVISSIQQDIVFAPIMFLVYTDDKNYTGA